MYTYRLRTFYALIVTQTLSLIGSRMSGLAVGIWVYERTGNATPLVLVAFFALLPRAFSAGIAGILADRWNRRYVMAVADAGQALGTVLLAASIVTGQFQLWHLYAVVVLQAVFAMFQAPAFRATITMLVPDKHRNRANALQTLSGSSAQAVGPALVGPLYPLIGVAGIIAFDMITFVVAVVAVLLMTIPQPAESAEGRALGTSAWAQAAAGFRFMWSRRPLFYLVTFTTLVNVFFSGALTLNVPYIMARTGNDATLMGLILSIYGLGSVAGGLFMSVWGGLRSRIHTIMPGMVLIGVLTVCYGMARTPASLAVSLFAMMFLFPITSSAITSIMQVKIPGDIQGRAFAAMAQVSILLLPLAYLAVGPLADTVFEPAAQTPGWGTVTPLVGAGTGAGMGLLIALCGVIMVLVTLVYYSRPSIRGLEADLPDYKPRSAEAAPAAASPAGDLEP